MALADRLENRRPVIHGTPCSMGVLLDTLEGDELAALKVMLGDPTKRDGWTASEIYAALVAEGHTVGRSTIGKHRRRQCRCFMGEK